MTSLFTITRRFFPKPLIVFSEPVPDDEPIVFVANHEKNYGPSVMQLFFPLHTRPWIIYHMLDVSECKVYIRETYFKERLHFPPWLSQIFSALFAPILVPLMKTTNPVPVFRGNPQRIVETFRQSLHVLKQGENLLLFPERPDGKPYGQTIHQFFDGFLYITKLYHRETGKNLLFYPVSINPNQQTVTVGKGVRFNPNQPYGVEAERIRIHLMQEISSLYDQPWPVFSKDSGHRKQDLFPNYS